MTGINYEAAAAAVNEIFEMNALTNVGFSEKNVVDAVLNAALEGMVLYIYDQSSVRREYSDRQALMSLTNQGILTQVYLKESNDE